MLACRHLLISTKQKKLSLSASMRCFTLLLGEWCCIYMVLQLAASGCSDLCADVRGLCPRSGQTLRVFNSAGCYLNPEQAEDMFQPEAAARERQAGSWGPNWLISQSPEVLHSWASSLLSQEPGCYFISTSLKGQCSGEMDAHYHHLRLYTWR